MTKHARIVRLLGKGRSPAEIAKKIGCDAAYVRAVRAREFGNGRDTDRDYLRKKRRDEKWLAKERRRQREIARRRHAASIAPPAIRTGNP